MTTGSVRITARTDHDEVNFQAGLDPFRSARIIPEAVRCPPRPRKSIINRLSTSAASVVAALAIGCLYPAISDAEIGFGYTLVKDFPLAPTSSEERLCSFAFNDLGQVAYTTTRIDGGVSLYFWDGTASQLVYTSVNVSPGSAPLIFCTSVRGGVGINNSGLISTYGNGTDPRSGRVAEGFLFFRVGQGLISTQFPGQAGLIYQSRGIVNSAGQVAWRDGSGPGGPTGGTVGITGNIGSFSNSFASGASTIVGGPIVNDKGEVVQFAEQPEPLGDNNLVLLNMDPAINQFTAVNGVNKLALWAPPNWSTPGFNAKGFVALATQGPSTAFPNRQFRVVLINPDLLNYNVLADETNTTLHPSALPGISLNNNNQVLFASHDSVAGTDSIWVTTSPESPPFAVWTRANPLTIGSGTISNASIGSDAEGPDFWINSSSDIAFAVISNRISLIIAHPDPGFAPGNPILPVGTPLPGGGFQFLVDCGYIEGLALRNPFGCIAGSASAPGGPVTPVFIDPPLATGYQYLADSGAPNFGSVYIPAPMPGGQAEFTVQYNGLSARLTAGHIFRFTDQVPAGVASFSVTGIDVTENLDPTNPLSFVTGVTFLTTNNTIASFKMVPVVAGAAPIITPNIAGTLGTNGWYTSDVSVNFVISDPSSLITSLSGCGSTVINADTAGTVLTCTATGFGGPWTSTVTIKRDTVAPSATITAPASGASYQVGSSVSASYTCTDSTSGITSCIGSAANGAAIDTSSAGSKTFTVTATDAAGQTSIVSNTYTVAAAAGDTTPPIITPTVTGTLGDNGWYRSNVSLTWSVSDSQSTITSTHGCGPTTITSNTSGTAFTCSATSGGGTSSKAITIKRDDDAPLEAILWPFEGLTFSRNDKVPAIYLCVDLRSGIAQCAGTVPNGARIDTTSVGTKSFTLNAKDKAGNTHSSTVHYKVR